MANLIIKSSADNLVLQGSGGNSAITVAAGGTTTFAENATLSGTANALGTVTTGNLSNNNIVMPRFKEFSRFYYSTRTVSNATAQNTINISGSNYVSATPEHTGDILEFSYNFSIYCSTGYMGFGIQRATDFGFSENVATSWSNGRHAFGQFGLGSSDSMEYLNVGGSMAFLCSQLSLSADTTYYFRMIGATHGVSGAFHWGETGNNTTNNDGINFELKRWSIV